MLQVRKVCPAYWRVTCQNDPQTNPSTPDTYQALWRVLDQLEMDEEVQVVVFDSVSPHYFTHNDTEDESSTSLHKRLVQRLARLPVVTLASIRGRVYGAANDFILSCDLRFASLEQSTFRPPRVGMEEGDFLDRLVSLVGYSRALEICLGSPEFDARIAEVYGYVNRAVPNSQLDTFVDGLAQRIASVPRSRILHTKRVLSSRAGLDRAKVSCQTQTQQRIASMLAVGLQSHRDFGRKLNEYLTLVKEEGGFD